MYYVIFVLLLFLFRVLSSTSVVVILCDIEVSRHLRARIVVTASDVKRLVLGAAVEDVLVTPHVLPQVVDRSKHGQPQPFSLVLFRYSDFLYVADQASVMDAMCNVSVNDRSLLNPSSRGERLLYDAERTQHQILNKLIPIRYSQFSFYNEAPAAHHATPMLDRQEIVGARGRTHLVVPLCPLLLRNIADMRQHAQTVQVASLEVIALQWPDGEALGELDGVGREEGGREDWLRVRSHDAISTGNRIR